MAEKHGRKVKRNQEVYQKKVDRITKWYNNLVIEREKNINKINPNTKQAPKRKDLKLLEYYIAKLKKVTA